MDAFTDSIYNDTTSAPSVNATYSYKLESDAERIVNLEQDKATTISYIGMQIYIEIAQHIQSLHLDIKDSKYYVTHVFPRCLY